MPPAAPKPEVGTDQRPPITAAVVQQLVAPEPAFPITPATAGSLGMGVLALIASLMALRRNFSKTGLDVKRDGVEGRMLEKAEARATQAEADAREAWDTRTADAEANAEMRSELKYLKQMRVDDEAKLHELKEINLALRLELATAQKKVTHVREAIQGVGRNVDRVEDQLIAATRNQPPGTGPDPTSNDRADDPGGSI